MCYGGDCSAAYYACDGALRPGPVRIAPPGTLCVGGRLSLQQGAGQCTVNTCPGGNTGFGSGQGRRGVCEAASAVNANAPTAVAAAAHRRRLNDDAAPPAADGITCPYYCVAEQNSNVPVVGETSPAAVPPGPSPAA